jgi:cell wall assembly regulator SMI1
VERLRGNAIGNPARIPWPHRLLHDAANYIEAQRSALKARNDSIVKQAEQIDKLREALEMWQDAVRVDATMKGPVYMGVSSTLGRKAWEQTRAALAQGGDE